jgi:hypothetical protein
MHPELVMCVSADFKYGFAALMQLEYDDRNLNVNACDANGSFCPIDGNAVLRFCKLTWTALPLLRTDCLFADDLNELGFAGNVFVLLGMAFGFRLIAYWILRRKGPKFDHSI